MTPAVDIAANLHRVRASVLAAARRAGRNADDVTLVAVSKFQPPPLVREACRAGQLDFAENYVQELETKARAVAGAGVLWHFTGRIQGNKARRIVEAAHVVHSVDSEDHARALAKHVPNGRVLDVFLQVNIASDTKKAGVTPEAAHATVRRLLEQPGLRVAGLMTIAPLDTETNVRDVFRSLRLLRDGLRARLACDDRTLAFLSMGMSADFVLAVEEGATHIRIGTAIFGPRAAVVTAFA